MHAIHEHIQMDPKGGQSQAQKGTKRKRTAPPKDPNAPKRPLTAYQVFFSEVHPKLLSQQPDMKFPDVSRNLAGQWTSLTLEGKKVGTGRFSFTPHV